MDKPRYFDSWKGRIATAIVIDTARSWHDLRDATGLGPKSLNKVLAEMISGGALEKKDEEYRLEYELFKEYQAYYKTLSSHQKDVDKIRITKNDQKQILQWIDSWKDDDGPDIDLSLGHFFIADADLKELTRKLIKKARKEILIVNPFVKQGDISDVIRDADDAKVTLITREPKEWRSENTMELQRYHQTLNDSGIHLYYNNRVHSKLLIIDRVIGFSTSLNFYEGKTLDAGIATIDEIVISQMIGEILKIRDSLDTMSIQ